ncbi:MAG: choice-of-anchor Q domain-containing protein [Actinomycetota bacterium]
MNATGVGLAVACRRVALALLICAPSLIIVAGPARAATLTVTTREDSGPGSLRDTVAMANPGDTIVLPALNSDYAADSAPIRIDKPLTIQGAGSTNSKVNAAGNNRVFDITPSASAGVTFESLTIAGGNATTAPGGGGVLIESGMTGPVTFTSASVEQNSSNLTTGACCAGGAGIYDAGTGLLTLDGADITFNTATVDSTAGCCQGGGGVYVNSANIAITNSAISNNTITVNGVVADSGSVSGLSGSGGGGLYQHSGTVTVSGSTFSGNKATVFSGDSEHGGGAIYGNGGAITITGDSVFSHNTATVNGPTQTDSQGTQHCCSGGGAILQTTQMDVTDATFSGNVASVNAGDCCHGGGAILSTGQLTLTRVSLTGNTLNLTGNSCCSGGGAIQFDPPQGPDFMTINESLISGNTANFANSSDCCNGGGGIYTDALGGFYNNTTIANNTTNLPSGSRSDWGGGGVYELVGGRPDAFSNVTLSGNKAPNGSGGGVLNNDGPASITDSIFALNTAATGNNCFGFEGFSFVSHGYNVESTPDTCGFTGTDDQVVADTLIGLASLADNGGSTFTQALQLGSVAIDAGDPAGCKDGSGQPLATDQRGVLRPVGPRCDVGAFELLAKKPRPTTGAPARVRSSSAVVNGRIGASDLSTTVRFEWGTSTKYGHKSKATTLDPFLFPQSFLGDLNGLPHHTKIHFRLDATNALGTTKGKDRTFTTKK